MPSCCLKCHFDWEEEHAFDSLPQELADSLRREHTELRENGYPRSKVLEHAEREMLCFRWYCKPEIVAYIEKDHQIYSQGRMKNAALHGLKRR